MLETEKPFYLRGLNENAMQDRKPDAYRMRWFGSGTIFGTHLTIEYTQTYDIESAADNQSEVD